MAKYYRVNVIPRDSIDCNQLQSLVGRRVDIWAGKYAFKVGVLVNVLLNIGGITRSNAQGSVMPDDPTVSVNELARQLKLWQLN